MLMENNKMIRRGQDTLLQLGSTMVTDQQTALALMVCTNISKNDLSINRFN